MEATSFAALSEGKYWSDAIAFVQEKEGVQAFPFWQIVAFAWLCNGAMHFGMADLSIFRFARSASSGWAPSIGMFLGHYMGWICGGTAAGSADQVVAGSLCQPGRSCLGRAGLDRHHLRGDRRLDDGQSHNLSRGIGVPGRDAHLLPQNDDARGRCGGHGCRSVPESLRPSCSVLSGRMARSSAQWARSFLWTII